MKKHNLLLLERETEYEKQTNLYFQDGLEVVKTVFDHFGKNQRNESTIDVTST